VLGFLSLFELLLPDNGILFQFLLAGSALLRVHELAIKSIYNFIRDVRGRNNVMNFEELFHPKVIHSGVLKKVRMTKSKIIENQFEKVLLCLFLNNNPIVHVTVDEIVPDELR